MKPRVVERPAFPVVGMTGRFTRETIRQIPELWGRFAPRMGAVPGRTDPRTSYGVCRAVAQGEGGAFVLEYTACVEVASLAKVPEGMVGFTIPKATYAVFTHTGPIHRIGETWDAIHMRWLREAGLAATGGHDFERYDERWDPRTADGPVDIHVAVRPAAGAGPER
jgi:AraC family transcriptional regulator